MSLTLHLRADATPLVGAGHVMRCARLAEAWREAGLGEAHLSGDVTLPVAMHRLRAVGVPVHPLTRGVPGEVLVVDSYDKTVRRWGAREAARLRVLVDDLGDVAEGFECVWNPNPYGSSALYPEFGGVLVTGADAVPVRPDLPTWSGRASDRVAVTLGAGVPPRQVVEAVLGMRALDPPLRFVAAGDWAASAPGVERVPPDRMWTEFTSCGRLLTAGGSTVWEAAAVGIPAAVVVIADNQRHVGEWARGSGAPVVHALDASGTAALSSSLHHAILDARPLPTLRDGAAGVARRLAHAAGFEARAAVHLRLRPADAARDGRALWTWANDPETRAASFGRPAISWNQHIEWLTSRLADASTELFVAEVADRTPVGSIRFDTVDGWGSARLSYMVAPEARGRGYARELVVAGTAGVRERHPGVCLVAEVASENQRSLRVFRALGWSEESLTDRAQFRLGPPTGRTQA